MRAEVVGAQVGRGPYCALFCHLHFLLAVAVAACSCAQGDDSKSEPLLLGRWTGEILRPPTALGWDEGNEYGCSFRIELSALERTALLRSNGAAAGAALLWLQDQLGLAADGIETPRVELRNSESDPRFWWKNGHIVTARQAIGGVPVDGTSLVVWFSGSIIRAAEVRAFRFTYQHGSDSVCIRGHDAAIILAAHLTQARKVAVSAQELGQPQLVYNEILIGEVRPGTTLVSPAWAFPSVDLPVSVDAVTRGIRIND
jgi:hypothetical protein